ncbi:tRNA synthetases class I (I, L, M and V) family protein [Babesia divergens]|uniref:valine--tRNA ligase n=1 Tax=Babesia divergens TaxID=32595 RepID=A0AAD9G737_BABDI|nr:tRNA synthetases class I (I, L, M and V) family protein [Babesia divergens]
MKTLKKLGIDWLYSGWTLSSRSKEITRDVFLRLYQEKLITERLYPTFCRVKHGTLEYLNAAKVELVTRPVNVYSITLDVVGNDDLDGGSSQEVAGSVIAYTTVPGLLHATAAVAVGEEDYERLKGKMAVLPDSFRRVPLVPLATVIKDDSAVTDTLIMPGYSENATTISYMGNMDVINIVGPDGKLTNVPPTVMGLSLEEAEPALLKYFKHDKIVHRKVPMEISDKDTIVHVLPAPQLLLDVASISGHALDALERLEIDPQNRMSFLKQRLESKQPWCISRYSWWGVRVPLWYLKKGTDVIVLPAKSQQDAEQLATKKLGYDVKEAIKDGYSLEQDPRTLDTWFTSSLWPITTSIDSEEMEGLQPCRVQTLLFTCYDILHSWVARMLLMCTYLSGGALPFDRVVLHGLVNDGQGRKMSKSLGNTITADEFVSRFGALYGFPEIRKQSDVAQYIAQILGKPQEQHDPMAMAQARLSLAASASKVNMCHNIGDYDERIKAMLKKLGQITNYMNLVCRKLKLKHIWDLDLDNNKQLSSLESAISAQFAVAVNSLSELIESFEFRKAVETLEQYVGIFSNYAIPAHRHGCCQFALLFRWYVNMLRILMPFAVQLIQGMPLPLGLQDSDALLQWPDFIPVESHDIGMFDAMEDIVRQLRRHAHAGSSVPEVSVPDAYRDELESYKSLLSYIVQLTYNTAIDFNIK